MEEGLEIYLDFSRQVVLAAGEQTLQYYQMGLKPDTKADGSPVTIADRESEGLIRKLIGERFPGHAIVGEEYGETSGAASGASHRWIIDPIDGTEVFIHGVPLYAILLGLEIEGVPQVGAAYFPALRELVSAATGLGCWWNSRQVGVSEVSRLSEATAIFTAPAGFHQFGGQPVMDALLKKVKACRGWGDAYGYALVATGRAEIMLDPIVCLWDCAPFPPIFREAGGYFGDWEGNWTITSPRALGTNQALLPEVLELIRAQTTT